MPKLVINNIVGPARLEQLQSFWRLHACMKERKEPNSFRCSVLVIKAGGEFFSIDRLHRAPIRSLNVSVLPYVDENLPLKHKLLPRSTF